jgi:naphtho-gamma-pyrone polyketide synthase
VEKYKPEWKDRGFNVCDVVVPKPLIAKGGKQLFRVSATANWPEESAQMQVWSVTPEGKKILDHASCTIKFFDTSVAELEWKRSAYLIKRSIEHLKESTETGQAHRMKRGMVYKLFSALVEYDENYKSIQEVILDSDQHEATALVKFQAPPGNFHRNPFWIDSIGHLSGFIMNASDATDSKNLVYVNHGWDSMRCLKKFDPNVTYRTYVRMQPWQNSIYAGDVYLFDGDDIVAVYGGVQVCCASPTLASIDFNIETNSSKPCLERFSTLLFLLPVALLLSLLLLLSPNLLLLMCKSRRLLGPRSLWCRHQSL